MRKVFLKQLIVPLLNTLLFFLFLFVFAIINSHSHGVRGRECERIRTDRKKLFVANFGAAANVAAGSIGSVCGNGIHRHTSVDRIFEGKKARLDKEIWTEWDAIKITAWFCLTVKRVWREKSWPDNTDAERAAWARVCVCVWVLNRYGCAALRCGRALLGRVTWQSFGNSPTNIRDNFELWNAHLEMFTLTIPVENTVWI